MSDSQSSYFAVWVFFFLSLSEIKTSKKAHVAFNIKEMFTETRNAF